MKWCKTEEWVRNWASFQGGRFNFAMWFSVKNCRNMREWSQSCNPYGAICSLCDLRKSTWSLWASVNQNSQKASSDTVLSLNCNFYSTLPKRNEKKAEPSSIPKAKTRAAESKCVLLPSSILHFNQVNIPNNWGTVNVLEVSMYKCDCCKSKSKNEATNEWVLSTLGFYVDCSQ